MSHRPYPDVGRALRQLDRHVPGNLRDPHTYEPEVQRLADAIAERARATARADDVSARETQWP